MEPTTSTVTSSTSSGRKPLETAIQQSCRPFWKPSLQDAYDQCVLPLSCGRLGLFDCGIQPASVVTTDNRKHDVLKRGVCPLKLRTRGASAIEEDKWCYAKAIKMDIGTRFYWPLHAGQVWDVLSKKKSPAWFWKMLVQNGVGLIKRTTLLHMTDRRQQQRIIQFCARTRLGWKRQVNNTLSSKNGWPPVVDYGFKDWSHATGATTQYWQLDWMTMLRSISKKPTDCAERHHRTGWRPSTRPSTRTLWWTLSRRKKET